MMNRSQTLGIGDIAIHVPEARMDMAELVRYRLATLPHLERHYERAVRTTGQRAIRFPGPYEDTATLAAQAALKLLRNGRLRNPAALRYLIVGTETPLDHSKPVSAYVQGMLQRAEIAIPSNLSSFQVQHACAGGTLALLGVSSLIAAGGRAHDGAWSIIATKCSAGISSRMASTTSVYSLPKTNALAPQSDSIYWISGPARR